jgi:hypothetical protein
MRLALVLLLCHPWAVTAQTVGHADVAAFSMLTAEQIAAVQTSVLFVDRSVGDNINSGLTCLSTPYATALNSCKRWKHKAPAYTAQPEPWIGVYPRASFTFLGHSGIVPPLPCTPGEPPLACFVRYIDEHPTAHQVVQFMPSYLLECTATDYLTAMRGLKTRHPSLRILLATSSLPRGADAFHTEFNAAVRAAAAAESWPLLDVADIESHDQERREWCDNRDGVAYVVNGVVQEDYPDDGVCHEAVSPTYTSEVNGGHLGNPDVGKIRVAKGLWVLLTRLP